MANSRSLGRQAVQLALGCMRDITAGFDGRIVLSLCLSSRASLEQYLHCSQGSCCSFQVTAALSQLRGDAAIQPAAFRGGCCYRCALLDAQSHCTSLQYPCNCTLAVNCRCKAIAAATVNGSPAHHGSSLRFFLLLCSAAGCTEP